MIDFYEQIKAVKLSIRQYVSFLKIYIAFFQKLMLTKKIIDENESTNKKEIGIALRLLSR